MSQKESKTVPETTDAQKRAEAKEDENHVSAKDAKKVEVTKNPHPESDKKDHNASS